MARNGVEALQRISVCRYALVLLDLMMPLMSGIVFLGELERVPANERPIVIVLTAGTEPHNLDPNLVAGTIRKPFDIDLLVDMITGCISTIESREQLDTCISGTDECGRAQLNEPNRARLLEFRGTYESTATKSPDRRRPRCSPCDAVHDPASSAAGSRYRRDCRRSPPQGYQLRLRADARRHGRSNAESFLIRFHEARPESTTFVLAVRDPNSDDKYIDAGVVSAVLNKPLEIDTLAEITRECALVVPPPEEPLECPPSESEILLRMDRTPYAAN
jgi:CheY-like chemotaxis protein